MCLCACCFTLPICNGFSARNDRHGSTNVDTCRNDTVILVKSLEQLKALPKGTVIETCDLSKQSIKNLPNLRRYNIRRLNLSGNRFWPESLSHENGKLPKSLEVLDMSNCKIIDNEHDKKGRTSLLCRIGLGIRKQMTLSNQLKKTELLYHQTTATGKAAKLKEQIFTVRALRSVPFFKPSKL